MLQSSAHARSGAARLSAERLRSERNEFCDASFVPPSGEDAQFRETNGRGSTPMVPWWGRCTHLSLFRGDWDVHRGYGILTHGHMGVSFQSNKCVGLGDTILRARFPSWEPRCTLGLVFE